MLTKDAIANMSKQEKWQLVFSYQEEIDGFTVWECNTPQEVKDIFDELLKGNK